MFDLGTFAHRSGFCTGRAYLELRTSLEQSARILHVSQRHLPVSFCCFLLNAQFVTRARTFDFSGIPGAAGQD
jgi:hypothetical protein